MGSAKSSHHGQHPGGESIEDMSRLPSIHVTLLALCLATIPAPTPATAADLTADGVIGIPSLVRDPSTEFLNRDGSRMPDVSYPLIAEGKVMVSVDGGAKLPEGALISAAGEITTDQEVIYGPITDARPLSASTGTGAIRAMGDHKGSGLAIMCELLAGALGGGGVELIHRGAANRVVLARDPAVEKRVDLLVGFHLFARFAGLHHVAVWIKGRPPFIDAVVGIIPREEFAENLGALGVLRFEVSQFLV